MMLLFLQTKYEIKVLHEFPEFSDGQTDVLFEPYQL